MGRSGGGDFSHCFTVNEGVRDVRGTDPIDPDTGDAEAENYDDDVDPTWTCGHCGQLTSYTHFYTDTEGYVKHAQLDQ